MNFSEVCQSYDNIMEGQTQHKCAIFRTLRGTLGRRQGCTSPSRGQGSHC